MYSCTNAPVFSSHPCPFTTTRLYTLPLLIWHPMQLVIGSFVAPYVAAYVQRRDEEMSNARQEEKSDDGTASGGGPDETTIQDIEQGVVDEKTHS